jgi:ABC-type transport system involved in Fe-S cluster assembly fused permease/ATPase subunit
MEAMERLMMGRTTLMIAHRLSTLEACDARIEIDRGRIVQATGKIDIALPERLARRAVEIEQRA